MENEIWKICCPSCFLPPAVCLPALVSCAPMDTYRIMIVAGEPSGDAHAAALVNALRKAEPQAHFEFLGAAGPLMREAGVDAIVHTDDLAIMGLLEIGGALPKFWQAYKLLKRAALERTPATVILVAWPAFNFRLSHVF